MAKKVVVDASIALKWVIDEPDSRAAVALLTEWKRKKSPMIAPALLSYEVANILYQQVRKGDITLERAKEALKEILRIGPALDFSENSNLGARAIELTHQYGLLAAYDAHYLALAERENCELWTADTRMWRTIKGKISWVHCLDDYVIP